MKNFSVPHCGNNAIRHSLNADFQDVAVLTLPMNEWDDSTELSSGISLKLAFQECSKGRILINYEV